MSGAVRVACLGECMLELGLGGAHPAFGFGGDTLNTAVYLARALEEQAAQVHYVTALGDDPMSADMLCAWQREGIDTTLVVRVEDALPGLYVIRTDARGERSFYYWREQAAARRLFDDAAFDLARALAGVALLYFSGVTLAIFDGRARERLLDLVRRLRKGGTVIAYDSNFRPRLWPDAAHARAAEAELAPLVDIALPGFEDERALHGDASPGTSLERWLERGAREVVVCNGPGDAHCAHRAGGRVERVVVPAPARLDPVDTTAAGDSFNAAYLAARLQGESIRDAVEAGHALAGRVIMHAGAIVPAVEAGT